MIYTTNKIHFKMKREKYNELKYWNEETNEGPIRSTNFSNYRLHCYELDEIALFIAYQLAS